MSLAARDIAAGAADWRLWHLLAWQEVKQRYRRSTLGPIWLSLSMAVQMAVMGILMTFLLKSDFNRYLPYVCANFVGWYMITGILNEGSTAFIIGQSFIMQIKKPLTLFIMQTIWRNVIIAGHNLVVYIVVAIIFVIKPNASLLLLPLSLVLVLFACSWMALLLAVISARFRDVPMTVQSIVTVLFWATPVFYTREQLGSRGVFVEYNPFTHLLAVLREPLMGQMPSLTNWLVVIAVGVVGWLVTFAFFSRFRGRVTYWL